MLEEGDVSLSSGSDEISMVIADLRREPTQFHMDSLIIPETVSEDQEEV